MSLYYWDALRSPPILNQRFGFGVDPEELLLSPFQRNLYINSPSRYSSPWQTPQSKIPVGSTDKDKYQVSVDVQHFKPEELVVKTSGNSVIVEGKHEEKPDEHGFIYRHFVRKFIIPETQDLNQIQSYLSSDGVLTISAPKKVVGEQGTTTIPITQTKEPVRPIETKKEVSIVVDPKKEGPILPKEVIPSKEVVEKKEETIGPIPPKEVVEKKEETIIPISRPDESAKGDNVVEDKKQEDVKEESAQPQQQ